MPDREDDLFQANKGTHATVVVLMMIIGDHKEEKDDDDNDEIMLCGHRMWQMWPS